MRPLKPNTLAALNRMDADAAERAARAIVRYWHGMEFGMESIPLPPATSFGEYPLRCADYVNVGDPYDRTLLRDPDGGWSETSWGDYLEWAEIEYAEASGEQRCAYCGEWYDPSEGACHAE